MQRRNTRSGSQKVRVKPDKAERAAMRVARGESLRWRWPGSDAEAVRVVVVSMGDKPTPGRCAAFLRHECSDYERLVRRVGRFPLVLRALRLRVAQETGRQYPEFAEAAMRAAGRETNRQQTSLRRQMNARGLAE